MKTTDNTTPTNYGGSAEYLPTHLDHIRDLNDAVTDLIDSRAKLLELREQDARKIVALEQQRDTALAALRDIETRAAYSLARPDHTNNDIQLDYILQGARAVIAASQGG